jgi:hypothetical protein
MRTNLVKAAACVGVALAVALIGWTPGSSSGGAKAGAAVGPPSVVLRLPNQGTGLNGGKDIRVRVSITCSNAVGGAITVHVRQQRGNLVISGVGTSSKNYRCNGRSQVVPVLVTANRGFFVPGAANANGNVQVCNPAGSPCANGTDTRTMNLVAPNTTTSSTTSSSSIP